MSNSSGVFFAEKVPDAGDDRIVTAAESLLAKIVCAPKSATKEEVERAAGPSGTTYGWRVASDRDDCCIQCQDDPNRVHWLLRC